MTDPPASLPPRPPDPFHPPAPAPPAHAPPSSLLSSLPFRAPDPAPPSHATLRPGDPVPLLAPRPANQPPRTLLPAPACTVIFLGPVADTVSAKIRRLEVIADASAAQRETVKEETRFVLFKDAETAGGDGKGGEGGRKPAYPGRKEWAPATEAGRKREAEIEARRRKAPIGTEVYTPYRPGAKLPVKEEGAGKTGVVKEMAAKMNGVPETASSDVAKGSVAHPVVEDLRGHNVNPLATQDQGFRPPVHTDRNPIAQDHLKGKNISSPAQAGPPVPQHRSASQGLHATGIANKTQQVEHLALPRPGNVENCTKATNETAPLSALPIRLGTPRGPRSMPQKIRPSRFPPGNASNRANDGQQSSGVQQQQGQKLQQIVEQGRHLAERNLNAVPVPVHAPFVSQERSKTRDRGASVVQAGGSGPAVPENRSASKGHHANVVLPPSSNPANIPVVSRTDRSKTTERGTSVGQAQGTVSSVPEPRSASKGPHPNFVPPPSDKPANTPVASRGNRSKTRERGTSAGQNQGAEFQQQQRVERADQNIAQGSSVPLPPANPVNAPVVSQTDRRKTRDRGTSMGQTQGPVPEPRSASKGRRKASHSLQQPPAVSPADPKPPPNPQPQKCRVIKPENVSDQIADPKQQPLPNPANPAAEKSPSLTPRSILKGGQRRLSRREHAQGRVAKQAALLDLANGAGRAVRETVRARVVSGEAGPDLMKERAQGLVAVEVERRRESCGPQGSRERQRRPASKNQWDLEQQLLRQESRSVSRPPRDRSRSRPASAKRRAGSPEDAAQPPPPRQARRSKSRGRKPAEVARVPGGRPYPGNSGPRHRRRSSAAIHNTPVSPVRTNRHALRQNASATEYQLRGGMSAALELELASKGGSRREERGRPFGPRPMPRGCRLRYGPNVN
ncbi:hypothetical protein EDC01DRAFT_791775 [Geopyxis carbonaria]|nr:hypothetical protein EDC01DRAFT_791775 [Geopyxis carbonaria]